MWLVYVSHGGGEDGDPNVFAEKSGLNTVSRVEHYSCGVAGLLVTAASVFLVYPLLVALTRPLSVLSSTAVTVVFVVTWLTAWALFECAWVWQSGRATVD